MRTEKQLIKLLVKYDHIIIYGAGMVGRLIGNRLLDNKLQDKIVGYAISERNRETDLREKINGLDVYEIFELEKYVKKTIVIIATMPDLHEEIKETLHKYNFEQTIFVTVNLYENLCKKYISNFQQKSNIVFSRNIKEKILFMASDNNKTSGAFLCMIDLCEMLLENNILVLVVLPKYGTGEELLILKNIPYTYIPSKDWGYEVCKNSSYSYKLKFLIGLLSNYKAKMELIQLIQKYSISLLHCNTSYTYIGAIAAIASDIPFVWHFRENMYIQGYRIFAEKLALKLIQKADKVIAVSEYIRKLAILQQVKSVKVVYDPVESNVIFSKKRNIFNQEIVQMIIVGAITCYKGQKELIEACSVLLKRNVTNFCVVIVGKGDDAYIAELRRDVVEYHLNDKILFYGSSSNVYDLYAKSDISFMCCGDEAYGRVTIESLLCGCLVIGADTGATPELIDNKETGLLYKAGDANALADCIEWAILNQQFSKKIAEKGQMFALKMFTKEKSFHQILEIYCEILKMEKTV